MPSSAPPPTFRFGAFELDLAAYELRRRGRAVRLERRPMDLLILLLERPGQLVSRSEIVSRLWGPDVFVDVDIAVNTAIKKVRQALRDSVEAPAFVETVTGKGYRFIAAVERGVTHSIDGNRRVMMAVLPFTNLGAGAEREYIADGFTEEAIAALGQLDSDRLGVIGRTSVMGYKGTTKSLVEIGRELGVTHVLESSIRAEGARWRITAKLIRVPDQTQLWSGSYDSEPSNMLDFQRELCGAIAEQIRLRFDPRRLAAFEHRRSLHAGAYDLYLQGRHFWNQLTPSTSRRAVECYTRAAELDPGFALAWPATTRPGCSSPGTPWWSIRGSGLATSSSRN